MEFALIAIGLLTADSENMLIPLLFITMGMCLRRLKNAQRDAE